MKKTLNIIIYSFTLFILSGCKKTLEENPRTFVNPDVFFTKPDSYDRAVLGIYRTLPATLGTSGCLTRETFSDIIGTPSAAYGLGLLIYQNNHQPFFENVRDMWGNHYAMINWMRQPFFPEQKRMN